MSKKQPIKKDETTINFRISKELKAKIETKAEERNLKTSAYMRDLLESVHNGDYCHKEEVASKINSFLFSKEFMQLLVWIYTKKEIMKRTEDDAELDRYVRTLKQIDGHLPESLVKEFDKVLSDIIRVQQESSESYSFHWYILEDKKKFNRVKVEKFLLSNFSIKMFISTSASKRLKSTN